MSMNSPYNFAPLANHVFVPDEGWARRVSHDLPFENGLSGTIDFTLHAHTPLLVGNEQTPSSDKGPGEVHPFRAPDGRYGVPGSSLRGMIRAVLEIATFARMDNIDDRTFALRDFINDGVKKQYDESLGVVKAGFMRLEPKTGLPCLIPCDYAVVSYDELQSYRTLPKRFENSTVREKYENWKSDLSVTFNVEEHGRPQRNATQIGRGAQKGILVFTGSLPGKKKCDFIFFARDASAACELSEDEWIGFLNAHEPPPGTPKRGMGWPDHWEKKYKQGHEVPVFYTRNKWGEMVLGLARKPRLAQDYSTHDALRSLDDGRHLDGQAGHPDLPALMFGYVDGDDALRGRVSFEPALCDGPCQPQTSEPVILNGPKPSFFPAYLQQPTEPQQDRLDGADAQYVTYLGDKGKAPRLRGWKRYPAREGDHVRLAELDQKQDNTKVQTKLEALPAGTAFKGRVVFHNLRPEELGALYWALTWGGVEQCRHGLGMGKPFGYGAVSIRVDGEEDVRPNKPDAAAPSLRECGRAFAEMMDGWCRAELRSGWYETPTMIQLLAMADPANVAGFKGRLQYPVLKDFQTIKKQRQVLPAYFPGQLPASMRAFTDNSPQAAAAMQWLDNQIGELMTKNRASEDDTLRGKGLAEAWQAMEEAELREQVRQTIVERWRAEGWWDNPPGKSAKKAKAIYSGEA